MLARESQPAYARGVTRSRPKPESPRPALPDAVAEVFARVAAIDPLLVEAADEVDLGLVRAALARSPLQRLRAARGFARMVRGLRLAEPERR